MFHHSKRTLAVLAVTLAVAPLCGGLALAGKPEKPPRDEPLVNPALTFLCKGKKPGTNSVAIMTADGSQVKQVTPDGSYASPVWSPDGTKIAFWTSGGLYVVAESEGVGGRLNWSSSLPLQSTAIIAVKGWTGHPTAARSSTPPGARGSGKNRP